jgi:hypothetical protein
MRKAFHGAARAFPALSRAIIRMTLRLPVSRLRTRAWRYALAEGFAASDRRDWRLTRTFLHPACEIDLTRAGGYALGLDQNYRGIDGYITWFESFTEGFSDWDTAVREVVAPPGTRIVAVVDTHARGAGSGIDVGGEISVIFSYEGGWLVRIEVFADSDEALAAVGVRRRPRAGVS